MGSSTAAVVCSVLAIAGVILLVVLQLTVWNKNAKPSTVKTSDDVVKLVDAWNKELGDTSLASVALNSKAVSDMSTKLGGNITTNANAISALQTSMTKAEGTLRSVANVPSDLQAAQTSIATLQSFMTKAEGTLKSIDHAPSGLQADISALQASMAKAEGTLKLVAGVPSDLQAAKTSIATLQSFMKKAEGTLKSVASAPSSLQAAQSSISALQTSMAKAEGTLKTVVPDLHNASVNIGTMRGSIKELHSDADKAKTTLASLTNGKAKLNVNTVTAAVRGWTPTYNYAPAGMVWGQYYWNGGEVVAAWDNPNANDIGDTPTSVGTLCVGTTAAPNFAPST